MTIFPGWSLIWKPQGRQVGDDRTPTSTIIITINRKPLTIRVCWTVRAVGIACAIGIIGAVIGSFLFGLLGVTAGGFIGSVVMATIGALVLLYIVSLVKRL